MSSTNARIVIVDDDTMVRDVVARYLHNAGFSTDVFGDGEQALLGLLQAPPDLAILDVMLPGLDGLELFRRLRVTHHVPIILLTALGEEHDRLIGLELGADDYVTKPFSPRELVLRVQSVLRRTTATTPSQGALADAGIRVEVAARRVTVGDKSIVLTLREFDLLVFFLQNPLRVFSREALLLKVWGWEQADHSTVTVHIRRLREKIEADPRNPRRIVTVFGAGYRYETEDIHR